jgi:hypothetical protein
MKSRAIIYIMTMLLCLTVGLNIGYDLQEKDNRILIDKYKGMNKHLTERIDRLLTVKKRIGEN